MSKQWCLLNFCDWFVCTFKVIYNVHCTVKFLTHDSKVELIRVYFQTYLPNVPNYKMKLSNEAGDRLKT